MDNELVFLHYDSVAAAEQAMSTISGLEAGGFLELREAAIVSRSRDGSVSATPIGHDDQAKRATLGGVLGVVAGGLIGLPVIGAVAGASAAARKSHGSDELDEVVETVATNMVAGSAVLALDVSALTDPQTVTDRLAIHRDRLIRAEVPEALRARLDEPSD